jgi:hypothetical protein
MKKTVLLFLFLSCPVIFGQLKADIDKPLDIKSGIINKNPNKSPEIAAPSNSNSLGTASSSFLGLFNPENLTMHHSLGLSYSSFGGSGYMALGVYTNSLLYKFNDDLNFQMDASIVNSPYNSFGQEFSKNLNGIYITKAALNYKISDNARVMVEYRMIPYGMGYNPYGFSSYGMGGFGGFSRFGFGNDYFWDE